MAEETAKLERDNTMVATAKEGEAFLEAKGKVDEDAKTRAQQKEIEEITAEEGEGDLKRTRTMEETAKEGKELLDGEQLGKTRAQTDAEKNGKEEPNGAQENGKEEENKDQDDNGVEEKDETNGDAKDGDEDDEKAAMKRTRTMEETVKEGEEFLKKQKLDNDTAEQEVAS